MNESEDIKILKIQKVLGENDLKSELFKMAGIKLLRK